MSDDVFIGIVAEQGSKDVKCSGLFKFDPVRGYEGKLLVPFEAAPGQHLFELPPLLKKEALYCLIDGSKFGTIIWPDFRGGHQIKSFAARIINLRIRNFLNGAHVDASSPDITKITLISPIFAYLFSLTAFKTTLSHNPFRATIESVDQDDINFQSERGTLSLGISGSISPDWLVPTVGAHSYLKLIFHEPKTPIECIKLVTRIEHLFSLLTFNFIKAKSVNFSFLQVEDGKPSEEGVDLERARITEEAKTELERLDIPLHLNGIDFGNLADRFLKIFNSIEQTLNWHRIITAEERYLEDKYFYSVRMIEALFTGLKIRTERDVKAQELIAEITQKLSAEGLQNDHLITFIKERVTPNFLRPSLAEIIKHLKKEYAELKVVDILDSNRIRKLRGKEAHGSTEAFSPQEYQFMAFTYEILLILYRLVILEHCGLERSFLYAQLKKAFRFSRYFEQSTLDEYKAALKIKT